MSEELKPCPFCGGKADLSTHTTASACRGVVHCQECGSQAVSSFRRYERAAMRNKSERWAVSSGAREEAAAKWNRRV
ncbi:MAG: Lar family restriction alleviation protein [Slackia sp.]|nr:Lar family restriction alleviation protein [Slackia sp.]